MVDPDAKIEVLGVADGEQADPRWVIVNYDLLARNAERPHGIPWSGVKSLPTATPVLRPIPTPSSWVGVGLSM